MMTTAEILMTVQKRYMLEYEHYLYWESLAAKHPTQENIESKEFYMNRLGSLRMLCDDLFSPEDVQLMNEQCYERMKYVI